MFKNLTFMLASGAAISIGFGIGLGIVAATTHGLDKIIR